MQTIFLPPRLWLLSALAMWLVHRWAPDPHVLPLALRGLGAAALVVGLAVAVWHKRLFGRLGTNIETFGTPDRLVREGLFGVSRNPMYLGMVLGLAGWAVLLGKATPWLVVVAFAALLDRWHVPFEERALERRFGADYEAYRRQVRRWI